MYYVYFSYVAILAALMFYNCHKKNQPCWWAAVIFFAPVTTPYFIYQSRKKSRTIPLVVFLVSFLMVAGYEIFLYSTFMDKNKYSQESHVTRMMIQHTDALKVSIMTLDRGMAKLENLSKVESRINEIKNTLEFIEQLRQMVIDNQKTIEHLVTFASDHELYFARQNLAWVLEIKNFYTDRNVVQYFHSLEKYLNHFEELLKFTYVNFYNITEYKTREHLKNYDEYYLRYRRALGSHKRFNMKRIDFQQQFIREYPDAKPYLPSERQTGTLKLWE